MISAFDIFKIGIGPSSSHTVGPMNAGKCFIDRLIDSGDLPRTTRITVDLYGSLSLTGKGHATDTAVIMGRRAIRRRMSILIAFRRLSRGCPQQPFIGGGWRACGGFSVADSILFHAETRRAMKTVCELPLARANAAFTQNVLLYWRRLYCRRGTLWSVARCRKIGAV